MKDQKIFYVLAAAFVVLLVFALKSGNNVAPQAPTDNNPQNTETQNTTPTTTTAVTPTPKPTTAPKPTPKQTIFFLSPAKGTVAKLTSPLTILWNKAGGQKGSLSVYNATTNTLVGWIISETQAEQTTFTWNTTSAAISRYGGNRKDLASGTYVIKLTFDGNLPTVTSQPFVLQ
jgi:hypothetical protein